ncbi:hypothetical protein COCC4DRAFT_145153 [Bipolaris maydis ATCC 48331]|uniref:Uncharacterized protein n=2 Tax=Cochliobolus heterostrophus TaxID=5016 RepID=M2UW06_COCH5|nr:uncharacterized protein COCC4DRAFT_145153 [Bipolaris maydis ATCC 48331]EMD92028.1 hypothetical protein COCHEDRAFT_1173529 [Bipolaris maydis C5]KAJ5021366.1 hypothetical protein J3E73DRAFT_385946 [Bipolaris maydis]ENI02487.1 hypothetical protein COCC4DRAFT_145153 [Bipolaris maydis ATCC 48331]KAJ5061362.1 hypothetical protein J3E74DRAFT_465300 [Bipolaris maydis]KAJ6198492.1 hypothetical protein J3E72DRAFT_417934 [Bipolaris maydis]
MSDTTDSHTMYTPTTTASEHTLPGTLSDYYYPEREEAVPAQIPRHGCTYILRATSCDDDSVLTLVNGSVVLAARDTTHGSIYWECVETQGWLGWRNCSSNRFLCHDGNGRLKCTAELGSGWRQFTVTPVPKGGYVMQMLDWWTLRPVVVDPEAGLRKLGRNGDKLSEGVVWEFIKVKP